ncbi:hypothetical protein ABIB48_000226 [Arthrobacter sp. UYCu511]
MGDLWAVSILLTPDFKWSVVEDDLKSRRPGLDHSSPTYLTYVMYIWMMGCMSTPKHESAGGRVYGFTQARESLKAILDSSERGGLSTISRPDRAPAAVVNGESLRRFLALTVAPNVQVVNEDGAWAVFMSGQPFAAEATELGEALEDFVDALRDYAEDWEDHLYAAPNHRENWALVQLVDLSTDEQLTTWLTGSVA